MKITQTAKKVIAISLTIAIFIIILLNINIKELLGYFYEMNVWCLILYLGLYGPLYVIIAERWRTMLANDYNLSLKESFKMSLAGVSMNSFVPSKLGEFSKAYFISKEGLSLKRAVNSVFMEKVLDLFALCMWFLAGLIILRNFSFLYLILGALCIAVMIATYVYFRIEIVDSWLFRKVFWFLFKFKRVVNMIDDTRDFIVTLRRDRKRVAYIIFLSVLSWLVQLVQVYLIFLTLRYYVDIKLVVGIVPAAILFGLIPITIGGMGIRDSALIYLFMDYAPPSLMAGIGILMSTRYWFSSLIGLPFFKEYMSK